MTRAFVCGIWAISIGLLGCGGRDRDAGDKAVEVRPATVTEMGCLTARGERFVLTDLERREGQATTEAYELVGNDDELKQHVGKQVRVVGDAEAPRVAVVQESTPPQSDAKPEGTAGRKEPTVTTQSETRVEMRKLTVTSVTPTGESCTAEAKEGAEPKRPGQ